jgi:hypothetical protein
MNVVFSFTKWDKVILIFSSVKSDREYAWNEENYMRLVTAGDKILYVNVKH